MAWTEERVEKLAKMWAEGNSASDIAKELGDVTRNAVIGKVHRLGLKGRATAKDAKAPEAPQKQKAAPKATKPAEPVVETKPVKEVVEDTFVDKKIDAPDMDEDDDDETPALIPAGKDEIPLEAREQAAKVESESKRLTLLQLTERVCKWPIGDPATEEFWFCGHPSQPGKPYCEAHVELAFQAPMSRRDRR